MKRPIPGPTPGQMGRPLGLQGPRGWRATPWLGVALLALVGAGLWALLAGWAGRDAGRGPAVRTLPSSPAPRQGPAAAAAPAPVPAPAARVAASGNHGVRRAALEPGEAEICGFGKVRLPSDDPNPLQRIPPALRQATLELAEARLAASPQAAVRAAGLLIGARARVPGARARIQQLARLAAGSQDAAVYSLALRACRSWAEADSGHCGLLSTAQWARLEPANLQPWLALAAEAAARDDDAAEDSAMRQAAQARHSDERPGLLPALVAQGLAGAPPLQRALAQSIARGLQDGWTLTHGNHAEHYCRAEALADGSRLATCQAVADTLALHGTGVADAQSALAIGGPLGWPQARLQAVQQEQQAIALLADGRVDGGADGAAQGLDFSCERLARREAWARQVGAQGELQLLRERARPSPLPPPSPPPRRPGPA